MNKLPRPRQQITAGIKQALPVLFFTACIMGGILPSMASSLGPEAFQHINPAHKAGPVPDQPKAGLPAVEYLFMGTDNLKLNEGPPSGSGPVPVKGGDPNKTLEPALKPAAPKDQ